MWNQNRIEQHIADGVEESLTLDYKAAGAIHGLKKDEIQKDVSAFANSAGGVIIYGVREHNSQAKKHLPERIDPVSRSAFSKEWLEQVISGIQPRVPGVLIHPVQLNSDTDHCCYVVEVPQSDTIHQAKDHRYYRRYNFENRAMEDFEVREAMNRATHPNVQARVHLNIHQPWEGKSYCVLELVNVGKRIANHFLCAIRLPLEVSGQIVHPVEPFTLDDNEDGKSYLSFSLPHSLRHTPLFPSARLVLKRELELGGRWSTESGRSLQSTTDIELTVYADEMPALYRRVSLLNALRDFA